MKKAPPRQKLLSPPQVAEALQISVKTLKTWRYRRFGPDWVEVGTSVRYPSDDLDRWIFSRTRNPAALKAAYL